MEDKYIRAHKDDGIYPDFYLISLAFHNHKLGFTAGIPDGQETSFL